MHLVMHMCCLLHVIANFGNGPSSAVKDGLGGGMCKPCAECAWEGGRSMTMLWHLSAPQSAVHTKQSADSAVVLWLVFPPVTRSTRVQFPAAEYFFDA